LAHGCSRHQRSRFSPPSSLPTQPAFHSTPAFVFHGRSHFTRKPAEPVSYATPIASISSRHHTQSRVPVADLSPLRVTGEPATLRKHAPDRLRFDRRPSEEGRSPSPEGVGSAHATFRASTGKPALSLTAICALPVERYRSAPPSTFRSTSTWWTLLGIHPPSSALPVFRFAEAPRSAVTAMASVATRHSMLMELTTHQTTSQLEPPIHRPKANHGGAIHSRSKRTPSMGSTAFRRSQLG